MPTASDLGAIEVVVTVDGNNKIQVTPDPVYVSAEDQERIVWLFDERFLEVNFNNNNPFSAMSYTYVAEEGGACMTGPPLPGSEGGAQGGGAIANSTHKYTVQVRTADGTFITEDPRVIVVRRHPKIVSA
jgi:hypothetical protein